MSYWGLILILLAIVMVVGPIMLMKPSAGQKKIADLRQVAAKMGLKVRLDTYISGNQKQSVAVYSLFEDLLEDTGCYLLWRKNYAHGIHFHQDWEWQKLASDNPANLSPEQLERVHLWLESLAKEVVGVEINKRLVGLWWQEQNASYSLTDIHSKLKELATLLSTP